MPPEYNPGCPPVPAALYRAVRQASKRILSPDDALACAVDVAWCWAWRAVYREGFVSVGRIGMGAIKALGVHYRVSGAAGSCHALVVTADNPPDYDTVSGVQIDPDLLAGLLPTRRVDVAKDSVDGETGQALGTASTWHYREQCPDA